MWFTPVTQHKFENSLHCTLSRPSLGKNLRPQHRKQKLKADMVLHAYNPRTEIMGAQLRSSRPAWAGKESSNKSIRRSYHIVLSGPRMRVVGAGSETFEGY